ncbi:response regulator transcription factor [Candidatus Gracilibacteria bacterium]|nr:response regulator transcription factor [Candidatus Gracilibacteria bacterium]
MGTWRIQIVDKDRTAAQITRRGIACALGSAADVRVALSANDAWLACTRGDVDLLIVDPTPNDVAALGLIRALRHYRNPVQLLVLTAYDTPGLRSAMRRFGVKSYAAKPIELRDLLPSIRHQLQELHDA